MESTYKIKKSPDELIGTLIVRPEGIREVVGWKRRDLTVPPRRAAFSYYATDITLKLDNGCFVYGVVLGPRF